MFGGKALGQMAGTLIWMPGPPGKRTLSNGGSCITKAPPPPKQKVPAGAVVVVSDRNCMVEGLPVPFWGSPSLITSVTEVCTHSLLWSTGRVPVVEEPPPRLAHLGPEHPAAAGRAGLGLTHYRHRRSGVGGGDCLGRDAGCVLEDDRRATPDAGAPQGVQPGRGHSGSHCDVGSGPARGAGPQEDQEPHGPSVGFPADCVPYLRIPRLSARSPKAVHAGACGTRYDVPSTVCCVVCRAVPSLAAGHTVWGTARSPGHRALCSVLRPVRVPCRALYVDRGLDGGALNATGSTLLQLS